MWLFPRPVNSTFGAMIGLMEIPCGTNFEIETPGNNAMKILASISLLVKTNCPVGGRATTELGCGPDAGRAGR